MTIFENGDVHIIYHVAGAGFPVLLMAPSGVKSVSMVGHGGTRCHGTPAAIEVCQRRSLLHRADRFDDRASPYIAMAADVEVLQAADRAKSSNHDDRTRCMVDQVSADRGVEESFPDGLVLGADHDRVDVLVLGEVTQ